jgi:hypothetical protein
LLRQTGRGLSFKPSRYSLNNLPHTLTQAES